MCPWYEKVAGSIDSGGRGGGYVQWGGGGGNRHEPDRLG